MCLRESDPDQRKGRSMGGSVMALGPMQAVADEEVMCEKGFLVFLGF